MLVDVVTLMRQLLIDKALLTAQVGARVYGSPRDLRVPPDYRPDVSGPCIAFTVGAASIDYSSLIHTHQVELRTYHATDLGADYLGRLVYQQINDRRLWPLLVARLTSGLSVMQEPDTGWFAGFSTYQIQVVQPVLTELIVR